jgi:hypothetical protein
VLSKSAQENPIDFFNNKLLKKHPNASFILFSEEKDQNILSKYNHSMLFMDGYSDEALIGVRFMKDKPVVAAYSDTLCLDALMSDGIDYFEYNTRGSFYNNHTPAIVTFY